jgi:hypothetical protein
MKDSQTACCAGIFFLSIREHTMGRVWFGFFLTSLSEKLAVGKSWLLGKAGG